MFRIANIITKFLHSLINSIRFAKFRNFYALKQQNHVFDEKKQKTYENVKLIFRDYTLRRTNVVVTIFSNIDEFSFYVFFRSRLIVIDETIRCIEFDM